MKSNHTARHLIAATLIPIGLTLATVTAAGASSRNDTNQNGHASVYTAREILSGMTLSHTFTSANSTTQITDPLTKPDDITSLGNSIFVGFQNGVGPQGGASADGNLNSTIVELNRNGDPLAQWDVVGKIDGFTGDQAIGQLVVTVNEDGNSSLYTINPEASSASDQVTHYAYNGSLAHNGGTDAVSIVKGKILVTASAPGSTGLASPQPTYPAVYSVQFLTKTKIANLTALFYDEDSATIANLDSPQAGQPMTLGLTDPDSSALVPPGARFGGDYMVNSQGDQQLIFVKDPGTDHQRLSVLSLTQAVDDVAWPTRTEATLYSTDSTNDSIDTVTGPFVPNQPIAVATPCGSNSAPTSCTAPNYLATLNPGTGLVTAIMTLGAAYVPQGGLLMMTNNHQSHQ